MGRRYPTIATAVTALIAQACGLVTANHDSSGHGSQVTGSAGQATGGSASGSGNSSGGLSLIDVGGSPIIGTPDACQPSAELFADQVVLEIGEQRTFYSWTTAEQVAELRAGTELFSRSERPGLGRGLLFTELLAFAKSGTEPAQLLADALANKIFSKARFAWTNPWATLLGFPGETYGDQLLEVELKPEAWIARFEQQSLVVIDAKNQLVPLETALASPERIGAIYYQSRADRGARYCGSFSQGAVAFREFALGNIDMVARWSLATPEIAQRLQDDIAELKTFQDEIACLRLSSSWPDDVACEWSQQGGSGGALRNYDFALGLPSELYLPSPENISALIAALEMSLPTGAPLVVTPDQ